MDQIPKNESNVTFELESEPSPPKKRSIVQNEEEKDSENSVLILSDDLDSNGQKKNSQISEEDILYPTPIKIKEEKIEESPSKQDPH